MLQQILEELFNRDGSDAHLTTNLNPCIRIHGTMHKLDHFPVITSSDMDKFIDAFLEKNKRKHDELQNKRQVDSSYETEIAGNTVRFRVNVFSSRGHFSAVLRKINSEIPSIKKLGLPQIVEDYFPTLPNGLVLVTGPTGSGKSTTLASIIDIINSTQSKHILTLEDPVEYLHNHKKSVVSQREIGLDVHNFELAIKSALREDPDIILVGEMRDLDTIATAITAAETGHLVFGTLHTISASTSIDRIIDVFEPSQQTQIRIQLATVIKGIISQQLFPAIGGGRALACEIMIADDATRGIIKEGKNISRIDDQIILNRQKLKTQSMDMSLASLFLQNKIPMELVQQYARSIDIIKQWITMGKV